MISNLAAFVALFGAAALASPVAMADPQGVTPVVICSVLEYQNLKQEAPFDAEPRMAAGGRCTSGTEVCEITRGHAFSVTIEKSISASAGGELDLGKIFSAGVEAQFTYTWGTTEEGSESVTVTCPAGGLTCGVMGTAKMVKITGEAKATSDPLKGESCFPPTDKWEPFELVVPVKESDSDAVGPWVDYEPCLEECNLEGFPDSCNSEGAQKLPECPSEA